MLVVLAQELFEKSAGSDLLLLELIAMGRRRRHVLLTVPIYDPVGNAPVNNWLKSFPLSVQKEADQILRHGKTARANLPADVSRIRVGLTEKMVWDRGQLDTEQAVELLRSPLRLLVENHRADLAFLRWLLPRTQREELNTAVDRGWVEVLHAGGLGEMTVLVEELATAPAQDLRRLLTRLRLWVMFDRDSDPADRKNPSDQSQRLKLLCSEAGENDPWPLSHHQLGRRSIENYLPNKALARWSAQGGSRATPQRLAKLKALKKLEEHDALARWQYNMKRGFLGDVSKRAKDEISREGRDIRDDDLDGLFRGLDENTRRALQEGFGPQIADLFTECGPERMEPGFEHEYAKGPPGQPTREELADSIFARM